MERLGLLDLSGYNFCTNFGTPFWDPFWAQAGQERFPTSFFRLLRSLRVSQEGLQRLSEGLRVEDAIGNQFWNGFGSDLGDPGP